MGQHHKGGQDLLCSATEGRGTDRWRSQQLRKAPQKRAAARTRGYPHRQQAAGLRGSTSANVQWSHGCFEPSADRQEQLPGAQHPKGDNIMLCGQGRTIWGKGGVEDHEMSNILGLLSFEHTCFRASRAAINPLLQLELILLISEQPEMSRGNFAT